MSEYGDITSQKTPSGLSMILMVHETLNKADEETKQAYIEGRVNPNAGSDMRQVYNMEEMSSSVFNQILGVPLVHDEYKEQEDLFRREMIPENEPSHTPGVDPATDPFAPREGKALTWRNINMILHPKTKEKRFNDAQPIKILDGVWGECPPAMTTAILGPSGAGKTSLLNILAGRASSNNRIEIQSDIRLNNYTVDPSDVKVRQLIAFVAQDDSLVGTQTPRDCIRFSARLRLPRSTSDKELDEITKRMLSELGLVSCADTVVGHALLKGISGGERKRTSVGVELVVKPGMVFLDEPTSGLDSFSAVQVCQVLKKVAKSGATVAFTIHQPSSDTFNAFDRVILLNKGRLMYQGTVKNVVNHFASRGFPCPPNHNPSDFIMTVAQANSIENLEESGFFEPDRRDLAKPFTPADGTDALGRTVHRRANCDVHDPPGFFVQFSMLFVREFQRTSRDPSSLVSRLVVATVQALLIGAVFYNAGSNSHQEPPTETGPSDHFGAVMIMATMSLLGQVQPAILTFPDERPIFVREYSTNHYGVIPYFISKFIFEVILVASQAIIVVSIVYWLVSFQGSFLVDYFAAYLIALSGGAMGTLVGAIARGNRAVATQFMPLIVVPNMMFSGFFVATEAIPAFLRWIQYTIPLGYGLKVLVINELGGCVEYDCNFDADGDMFGTCPCQRLIDKSGTNIDDENVYWFLLFMLFVFFRIAALIVLERTAGTFL